MYRSDLDVRGGTLSTNRYNQGCIARYINAAPAPGTGPANLVDDTIGCQWTTGIGDGRYNHIHPLTLRQRNQNSSPFSIILVRSSFVNTYTTITALTHPHGSDERQGTTVHAGCENASDLSNSTITGSTVDGFGATARRARRSCRRRRRRPARAQPAPRACRCARRARPAQSLPGTAITDEA
jgi:hypothetical protein